MDGLTLLISSSDGFCSTLSFSPGELGETYTGEVGPRKQGVVSGSAASNHTTPVPTPTSLFAPPSPFRSGSQHRHRDSASSITAPSPPPTASFVSQRPSSPARTNSTSSVVTRDGILNNPSLTVGQVPSVAATNSGKVLGVPMTTPPETPRSSATVPAPLPSGVKRETADSGPDDGSAPKRRRIAPTLVPQESTENSEPKQ
jgi:chromatin assembly factor 1 subunit B